MGLALSTPSPHIQYPPPVLSDLYCIKRRVMWERQYLWLECSVATTARVLSSCLSSYAKPNFTIFIVTPSSVGLWTDCAITDVSTESLGLFARRSCASIETSSFGLTTGFPVDSATVAASCSPSSSSPSRWTVTASPEASSKIIASFGIVASPPVQKKFSGMTCRPRFVGCSGSSRV
ncbi:hypothetical protein BV25DRAFT_780779 [Artomyces pyxidatus]|uniref:Uncharacterized protein n=1 Tax=Artomyces pyxidatus TaxID=48021 RepID=A0ACB8SYR2_9AGAM|nr:hypothetical protein BV25DRAFT_780779 [Artomyces pyxidatus]